MTKKRQREANYKLLEACETGSLELVKEAIEDGAEINIEYLDEKARRNWIQNQPRCVKYPWVAAAEGKHLELVDYLLSQPGTVMPSHIGQTTPLTWAMGSRPPHVSRLNNVDPLVYSPPDDKLVDLMKLLIKHKANINGMDKVAGGSRPAPSHTPLTLAVCSGHRDMVTLLLENGVNLTSRHGEDGNLPLHLACETENLGMVKLLLDGGCDVEDKNWLGETPLELCCRLGYDELIELLVTKYKANVNPSNLKGSRIRNRSSKKMSMHGNTNKITSINNYDCACLLLLYLSTLNPSFRIVELLINAGARTETVEDELPLCLAACQKRGPIALETVKLLIFNCRNATLDALVNCVGPNGTTPLLAAVDNNNLELVQYLVDHGADINICNADGRFPVLMAIVSSHLEIVDYLLELKPNFSTDSQLFKDVFVDACRRGAGEMALLLLKYGADVNCTNRDGHTGLFLACQASRPPALVSLLLDNGADPNIAIKETNRNKQVEYRTALQYINTMFFYAAIKKKVEEMNMDYVLK